MENIEDKKEEVLRVVEFINRHFEEKGRMPTKQEYESEFVSSDSKEDLTYEPDDQWQSP